jgi:hypothetical protein
MPSKPATTPAAVGPMNPMPRQTTMPARPSVAPTQQVNDPNPQSGSRYRHGQY